MQFEANLNRMQTFTQAGHIITAIAAVALLVAAPFWQVQFRSFRPLPPMQEAADAAPLIITDSLAQAGLSLPTILNRRDRVLYEAIFTAQDTADWKTADGYIAQLGNDVLMGHVLADRYLHKKYSSKPAELAAWLKKYPNHPQAYDIYRLTQAKDAKLSKDFSLQKRPVLSGFANDGEILKITKPSLAQSWQNGLKAWQRGDKKSAARHFSSMMNKPGDLPAGLVPAVAYWAYRSHNAIGNSTEAYKYLHMAAQDPRNFYGILARKQLRQPLGLDTTPLRLTDADMLEMIGQPAIRRVLALAEIDRTARAEKELRILFPSAEQEDKWRLLALAHQLNLASVQMGMAQQLRSKEKALDLARYPIPEWRPQGGFRVDPALVYALARQESGFHHTAQSHAGALGIMQIMPKTASMMQKRMVQTADASGMIGHGGDSVTEPEFNLALGQEYIQHLLDHDLVENNLFYLLAAYNAGPGRLQEWKGRINDQDDPLLFVESIPFPETRNYVMRVMANYWIYSELAGLPNSSVHAVLNQTAPNYSRPAVALSFLTSGSLL